MAKIILKYLNKELCCPVCESKDKFYYDKNANIVVRDTQNNPEIFDKFTCSCGWVMFYDGASRIIRDDVWDEHHQGDTIIE